MPHGPGLGLSSARLLYKTDPIGSHRRQTEGGQRSNPRSPEGGEAVCGEAVSRKAEGGRRKAEGGGPKAEDGGHPVRLPVRHGPRIVLGSTPVQNRPDRRSRLTPSGWPPVQNKRQTELQLTPSTRS
jgi:hypothetical protein